jgi:hypothetical protein
MQISGRATFGRIAMWKVTARPLAFALTVSSLLACGGVTRLAPSDRYTVTAELMLGPGRHPLTACHFIALSQPPPACGGVEVRGVDVQRVPGARRLSNGAVMTDAVRLFGWWDGVALNRTELPRRPTQPTSSASTQLAAEATPRSVAAVRRMAADDRELKRLGIQVLGCWPDGDNVVVQVPVADNRTVATLEQRYGPTLVSPWLTRA